MFAVIVFDNASHKDNEQTKVYGPFSTRDAAHKVTLGIKFFHVVDLFSGK